MTPGDSFGNYEYEDFEEVVKYITEEYFDEESLRWTRGDVEVYRKAMADGDLRYAECLGNAIKNCVAVHRLTADIPDFVQRYKGKTAFIWRGRFIGWKGEAEWRGKPGLLSVIID